ncbi:MAG: sialidase [Acidobacteria bacterium]|nr:sialidase [Acidobacteriota bacterium]
MSHTRPRAFAVLLCAAGALSPAFAQGRRGGGMAAPEGLSFRFMGPAVGNRISAAAGIPGDPGTYYAGAASGGVWKSINAGQSWFPIFDRETSMAIGSLAVAPSDPKTVWAGTGEACAIRDSDMQGDGIYKSTDAGATWKNMGLVESGRIGRILIHPKKPDTVYACVAGRMTGPQKERGVFRTTDGGRTWKQVLSVNEDTGCSGLTMDPNDPDFLVAGTWQAVMHTYAMFSGGPGSGVFVSHDGGDTWKRAAAGLPKSPVGKIDVKIAPSNPKRVYALIQTADQGSLWRSDDAGENWAVVNWQRALIGRAGYYIHLDVSPSNPDEVLVANSSFWISDDGGKSFTTRPWGGDTHNIWIDPTDGNRILVTHDGGMYMTTDHGRTSNRVTLPIGQIYHVAVDNDVPFKIYGNMQDDGTMRGPSNVVEAGPNVPGMSAGRGGFGRGGGGGQWEHGLGGCESGFTIPDPTDSNIVWATCYGNEVTRYDARTKMARSVSPWLHTLDAAPNQVKYRCHWTPPLAIDPFDHNTVYYGCQMILRTTNGGVSWSELSPDLSTRDPSRIVSSGGIVGDNLGQFYGEVVFSIAPSDVQKGLIWAGTNDGKVWYTKDGGKTWNDVTKNITGLPAWGTVSKIEPSHFDAGTAYLAVDFHLMDNRDPFLYRTTDYGRTWTKISDGLPHGGPLTYARVIAENPNRKGNLFAGTGNALYYSLDDGAHWKQFREGLPAAPVSWIVIQKQAHDAVVSTYGRGMYIMEDITPLEQGVMELSTADASAPAAKLVAPRPAYRIVRGQARALFSFWLKAAPAKPVELEVLDSRGQLVKKLSGIAAKPGLNRTAWDLRYDAPPLVALRTTPPENPHIWEEPRFQGQDTRPITHWGLAQAEVGPIAAPGQYTLRMTVDGQSYTQPLTILRTPDSHADDAALQSSVRLQLKVREDITQVSNMTNQLEWMRRQLEDETRANAGKANLIALIAGINRKLEDVEYQLITRADALSDDKYFQTAYNLYQNFLWLNGEIGTGAGDVQGSGDWGATETGIGLVLDLEKTLAKVKAEYQSVMDKDVPAYNKSIEGTELKPLKTTGAPPPPPRQRFGFGG